MGFAIFTAAEQSHYDDALGRQYHFPSTYLAQARQAEGGWVVYYEPRRDVGAGSSGGRSAYFGMAHLDRIDPDRLSSDHHYARLSEYIEFDHPVPFREGARYYESMLRKSDGSTNKGAFGRSVRVLPESEFRAIAEAGFAHEIEPWARATGAAQESPLYAVRPRIESLVSRPFRDDAFRRHVREAYSKRCAMTGLCLINGGGRPEVQAAHIVPVASGGSDSVRNGLALTSTFHWLFDRGLVSVGDDLRILVSPHGVPEDLNRLIVASRCLLVPGRADQRPSASFLQWHREQVFKY